MEKSYTLQPSTEQQRRDEQTRVAMQAEQLYGGFSYVDPVLPRTADARVLDVGCGPANLTAYLASRSGASVTGIDHDDKRIAAARERYPELTLTVGEATALPFPDGTFDLTHSRFVLMHVTRPEIALTEMFRVTRPGGTIVLHEGFHDAIWLSPRLPDFDRLVAAWRALMEERGQDHSFGIRAFEQLSRVGAKEVSASIVASHATSSDGNFRRYVDNWVQMLPGLRESLAGRVPESTFAALEAGLPALASPATYLELTVVATGKKPA